MKKVNIFIFFVSLWSSFNAQTEFSVTPTFVNLVKTTDYSTAHDYIQINNLVGLDVPMRWVAIFASKSGCPNGWDISLADPDSNYVPLNDNDSADFILSASTPTYNKLVIGVAHNGEIGSCAINFRLYSIADPSNEILVGFNVTIDPGVIGISDVVTFDESSVYPNPSSGHFSIKKIYNFGSIYDVMGNMLFKTKASEIDLSNYSQGIYFLHLEDDHQRHSMVKLIKFD